MKITDLLLTADKQYSEVLEVTGTLTLDPNKSITLSTNSNIIVTGKLISKPVYPAIHKIVFTGIDESKFHGGGDVVLPTDIGLWVTGSGQLDIEGEDKTSWTNALGAIKAGDITFPVKEADNWRVGDELVISRTAKGATDDDVRVIKSISGLLITVDKPLTDHPVVNNMWTAEVLNLTRNMRIEGTASGQSHVFIKSTSTHNVSFIQFRYMGPRKNIGGDSAKELVTGRYALHFHHCEEATRGMEIEGCVARDCNNHAYVPHGSHGMMWCKNIGYNCLEINFWYDIGHMSHDLTYLQNIMGKISFVSGAMTAEDPTTPTFGAGGILLGMGDGNRCIGNVGFAISGRARIDGTGFLIWTNDNESTWFVDQNLAHHCSVDANKTWQNTAMNHTVSRSYAYYCTSAIFQGAYANVYAHKDGIFCDAPVIVHAGSLTNLRLRFEGLTIINGGSGNGDSANINAGIIQEGSPVDTIGEGQPPVLYRNCKFINCKNEIVLTGGENSHYADVVDCNIQNPVVKGSEQMRVQQNGKAYLLTAAGKKDIPLFAPTIWGTGDGVLVEYFSDTNFKNKVAELIQPQMNFTEWQNLGGAHHLCPGPKFSIRCTGKWQPQFTDTHTFSYAMDAGGSVDFWIEGTLVKGSYAVKAGEKYNFKLEFKSTGSQIAGFALNCNCPAMQAWSKGGETIPQSQLYTPGTITPPVNQPPKANAGADQTITLPVNSTVLNGTGSDADGVIKSYLWTKQSGPVGFLIANPSNPSTQITGLTEGVYTFALAVTDDKGDTVSDTVAITVKPAVITPPNQPPVVTASASVNIIQSQTIFLNGKASDPEGKPLTFLWRQDKGSAVTINNPTALVTTVDNAPVLPAGGYKFTLKVTDSGGNIVEFPVTI